MAFPACLPACLPLQTWLSSFLLNKRQVLLETVAPAWNIIGATGAFRGFFMGWPAGHITVRRALTLNYGLLALAHLLVLTPGGNAAGLYVASASFSLAFYPIFGLLSACISHLFPKGTASLIFHIPPGLGGIAGNAAGGWPKDAFGSFGWTYGGIFAAAIASMLLSLLMQDKRNPPIPERGACADPPQRACGKGAP